MENLKRRQQQAELEKLAAKGRLNNDSLIAEARKKKSPLHEMFEWDTEKNVLVSLRQQARRIITSFRVTIRIKEENVAVPIYVRDPEKQSTEQGYVPVDVVRTDEDIARIALSHELARAIGLLKRARGVAAALGFEGFFDEALGPLLELEIKLEEEVAA